jgi:hypothetical protein
MQIALAITIGLALSAACGLRVFVPLLALSVAAKAGAISLAPSLAWIGGTEAVVALAVATVLEIAAYKVPWLDHALDTIASPAAVLAGILVSASQIGAISGVHPLVQWSCAIIAGGGIAGLVQAGSVSTRAASTLTTAGLANPIVSAVQSVLAVIVSVLAILVPVVAASLVVLVLVGAVGMIVWIARGRRAAGVRRLAAAPAG